jgi:glycosyltransferase involved in cell wall biosynthesis
MLVAMPDHPVLLASYSGVLGGAERVLLDSATRLQRPVLIACPEGPLAAEVRAAGLAHAPLAERSLRLGAGHAAGLAGAAWELRGLAAQHDPSALVAWGARAVLASALLPRRGRPPLLAVHHDLQPNAAVRTLVRAARRRADGVAAASHAIAREVGGEATRKGGDGSRRGRGATAETTGGSPVGILHPGVDLDAFAPSPLPPGTPHALVLGALVGWKRPDLALEIAALVPELRLTLAGATLPGDDGRLEAALRERASRRDLAGRVTLTGALQDVRPSLAAAHVLLHCSDAEPYGLALVEALAAGRPVVAAAAAGPLEIVTGGAGRLYPPGDAQAAAKALREVLADPDAGRAARRRAEAAFDVRDSANRLETAIDRVIASRTPVPSAP